jgi:membrane fusion protein (multidrug efflux system)
MVDMADFEMKAPVDGVVARRTVDPGEVVDAGQGLFQLVENGRTWVVANLEEHDIAELREGQPVEITLDAYPGLLFQGKVGPLYGATLSRFSLLATSSASGNFIKVTQRVPVRIDWAEPYQVALVPGLNAIVRIDLNGLDEEQVADE